jgi:hypothetical protein
LVILLGFVTFALYADPKGLASLNPFSGEDCAHYVEQSALSKQQQSQRQLSSGEGRETGAERNTRNAGKDAPDQQRSEGDYYACRLAAYTNKLAWFTAALVVATIALFGIGIYQGIQLGRHAAIAEQALFNLERPWLFPERVEIKSRSQPPYVNDWYITFIFRNVGRMPAIIEGCLIKFQDKDTLSPRPDYTGAAQVNTPRTVAQGDTFSTGPVGPSPGRLKNGKPIQFIAFGKLSYKELSGKFHKTGFAVAVSPTFPAFGGYQENGCEYYT